MLGSCLGTCSDHYFDILHISIFQISILLQDHYARSLPVERIDFAQMNMALVELEKSYRCRTGKGLSGIDSL